MLSIILTTLSTPPALADSDWARKSQSPTEDTDCHSLQLENRVRENRYQDRRVEANLRQHDCFQLLLPQTFSQMGLSKECEVYDRTLSDQPSEMKATVLAFMGLSF